MICLGYIPPTAIGFTSLTKARASDGIILGTHFSPFNQKSLGTDIPCYEKERNQGLVLDRILQCLLEIIHELISKLLSPESLMKARNDNLAIIYSAFKNKNNGNSTVIVFDLQLSYRNSFSAV